MKSGRTRLSVWGALVWFAGSYGVALIGYVLINAIASRMLGRQDFGYFVIAITATTLIGQIGLLGVHRSGCARQLDSSSPTPKGWPACGAGCGQSPS